MSSLECVWSVVITGTLVHVQHLDVHGHGHSSLELDPVPETVPPEEGSRVGDLPHGFPETLQEECEEGGGRKDDRTLQS